MGIRIGGTSNFINRKPHWASLLTDGKQGGIVVTIIACGWTQNGGTGGTAKRGLPERQRENENAKEIELKE